MRPTSVLLLCPRKAKLRRRDGDADDKQSEGSELRRDTNLERYAPQLKLVYMWSLGRLQRRNLPLGQPMQQRGLARIVQPCSGRQTPVGSGNKPREAFQNLSGSLLVSLEVNAVRGNGLALSRGPILLWMAFAFPHGGPSPLQILIFDKQSRWHPFRRKCPILRST